MAFRFKSPSKRELTGGDLLAQSLKNLGCDVAFGLHGGHLDAFLVGAEEAGIELIDTRHETVAVQAAEGFAKVKGKVGLCFVTANSGFANGIPGLASAFADRSPIFCVTSSPPLRDAETNALQGFHDQVVLSKSTTKFSHRVTNVEEIPRLTAYAYRTAMSGAPGPVLLDVPIDVLFSPPRGLDAIAYGAVDVPPAFAPAPDPAGLKKLLQLWQAADRPVIITGTGARGNGGLITKLAERLATPVFYSNKYSTDLPCDHELRAGPAMLLAALETGKRQPDFVLLIGARTGFLLGGRSGGILPNGPGVRLAQVDIDGSEIGKSHPIEVGLASDAALFCKAALESLGSSSDKPSTDWVRTCASLRTMESPFEKDDKYQKDGRLHPYHASKELMRALPRDSIVIIDGGECGQWAFNLLEEAAPKIGMVSSGYLGMLGNGWGYALGAALAQPSKLIVNIHGDGSAGFHLAELDTFARFGLRIMTVIYNNFVWGMSINGQELIYEGVTDARPAARLSKATQYETVAQGFGCNAKKVTKIDEIRATVEEFKDAGPSLINLIVSEKPTTPATLSMVGMTKDPDWIVVPYYDNIPRPYYKQDSNVNGS